MGAELVEKLKTLLTSPDQSVRLNAVMAAGTYPDPEYIDVLIAQCGHETDFFVRDTLSWALMRQDIEQVVKRLEVELQSENPKSRGQALHTFSKIGEKNYYSLITKELLLDPDDSVAMVAWRAASGLVPEDQVEALSTILFTQLGRGNYEVQLGLSRAICRLGKVVIPALVEATRLHDDSIRLHAQFTARLYKKPELQSRFGVEFAKRIQK